MRFALWRRVKEMAQAAKPILAPAPAPAKPVVASQLAGSQSGDIDLRALGKALSRQRRWIIVPTVAALVLSLIIVNLITSRYKSEARILIDGRENVFLRPTGELATFIVSFVALLVVLFFPGGFLGSALSREARQ